MKQILIDYKSFKKLYLEITVIRYSSVTIENSSSTYFTSQTMNNALFNHTGLATPLIAEQPPPRWSPMSISTFHNLRKYKSELQIKLQFAVIKIERAFQSQ